MPEEFEKFESTGISEGHGRLPAGLVAVFIVGASLGLYFLVSAIINAR